MILTSHMSNVITYDKLSKVQYMHSNSQVWLKTAAKNINIFTKTYNYCKAYIINLRYVISTYGSLNYHLKSVLWTLAYLLLWLFCYSAKAVFNYEVLHNFMSGRNHLFLLGLLDLPLTQWVQNFFAAGENFRSNKSWSKRSSTGLSLSYDLIVSVIQIKCFVLFNKQSYWSTIKHKPKHKLEKWFIISGDGVRPSVHTYAYVRTKQNKPIKELNHFSS